MCTVTAWFGSFTGMTYSRQRWYKGYEGLSQSSVSLTAEPRICDLSVSGTFRGVATLSAFNPTDPRYIGSARERQSLIHRKQWSALTVGRFQLLS